MAKYEDGSYGSAAGIALIAKVLAGRCAMKYTRVAVGKGNIPDDKTPKTMTEPADYVMDAVIAGITNPVDGECQVTVQINSANVDKGFYCTAVVLYAEDPDEGEVPYTYLVLENEPEWIRPASSIVGKLATIDLIAAVGDVDTVTAAIDPEAIATVAAVNDLLQRHNEDPEAHAGIIMDAVGSAMKKLEESGQIMSEDRVKELINESGGGGGAAIIKDITIPADGWDWQRESGDEETLGMDDFRCVVDVAVDDATEDVFPSVALHKAALEVAKRAGLCPTVQALAGVLRFWARNIPTEDMSTTVALFAPGGTTGGGSAYVLPVATANRLGGVKIGSGISVTADGTVTVSTSGITPEEVVSAADTDKMLDEIFPSES